MEIECQLDATDGFFIAHLTACSTFFGHHYSHHRELKSIIQVVAACGIWFFGLQDAATYYKPDTQTTAVHQTDNLKTKAPNTTGSNHLYNILELPMMGIIVSETCLASSKMCNKEIICCIYLAFYFHILTGMHGQTHIKFKCILIYFNTKTSNVSIKNFKVHVSV